MRIKQRDDNCIVVEAKSSTYRGRHAELYLVCIMLGGQGYFTWAYLTHQIAGLFASLELLIATFLVIVSLVRSLHDFRSPVEIQRKIYSFDRALNSLKDETESIFPPIDGTNEICKLSDIECLDIQTECRHDVETDGYSVSFQDWTIHKVICRLKSGETHILQFDRFLVESSNTDVEKKFREAIQGAESEVRIINDFIQAS